MFYVIEKWVIPFVQSKMSLRGPKTMRKVDDLSLIFFYFYVPALTPFPNSTDASLRLSENITLFAVCRIYTGVISKRTKIGTRCLGLSFSIRVLDFSIDLILPATL
jgi:hypothetical protein